MHKTIWNLKLLTRSVKNCGIAGVWSLSCLQLFAIIHIFNCCGRHVSGIINFPHRPKRNNPQLGSCRCVCVSFGVFLTIDHKMTLHSSKVIHCLSIYLKIEILQRKQRRDFRVGRGGCCKQNGRTNLVSTLKYFRSQEFVKIPSYRQFKLVGKVCLWNNDISSRKKNKN